LADRIFLVRFKERQLGPMSFLAERAELHGEHLVLFTSVGTLAAMLLTDAVDSWSEIETETREQPAFQKSPSEG